MLDRGLIIRILEQALSTNADFAEVFIEDKFQTDAFLVSSKVENVNNSKVFGIGVRVASGYQSVYGYTNSPKEDDLLKLANDLAQSFPGETRGIKVDLEEMQIGNDHPIKYLPSEVSVDEKVALYVVQTLLLVLIVQKLNKSQRDMQTMYKMYGLQIVKELMSVIDV